MPHPSERTTRESSSIEEATVTVRMELDSSVLEDVADRYMRAKRFVLQWLYEHKSTSIKNVHHAVYRTLRKVYKLPSRFAIDCYRDAIALWGEDEGERVSGNEMSLVWA